MAGVSSRGKPFPYSLLIGDDGVMVRDGFVGRKVQSLSGVVPNSAEYGHDDVYRETSFAFRAPLGMGQATQHPSDRGTSRRCRYGLNMWFAGNKRGRGPKWNNLAPTDTGAVSDFVEALHGGVVTQFVLAGRYIKRRDTDLVGGQATSKDFGAGRTITAAARFKPTGGTDSLYVTLDNGDLWQYDGTNWIGPAAAAGTWNGDALLCVVVGDDLYIKDTANTVRRATADPMAGANYSGQFTAGDGSMVINGMGVLNNALFALMDSGKVFTFNTDGSSNDITPELKTTPLSTNGAKPATDVRGWLYFRNGSSWFRLKGLDGGSVESAGPERWMDNDSEVSGVAQVFAWYGAYYGFWGIYNSSNGASYLLQFGDWLPGEDEDGFVFIESLNGALAKWAGRQVSAMRVQFIASVPRLYVGFTNGTYGWIKLPSNTPNPFHPQSGCEFSDGGLGASECFWSRHTMGKEADTKAFLHFQGFGDLSASKTVTVATRTSVSGAYADAGSLAQNGQRIELVGAVGTHIDVKETFVGGSSSVSPVLESLVLREQLRPSVRLEWAFIVKARHRAALRNGGTDSKTPDQIYDLCRRAADTPAAVSLTLPDEQVSKFHAVHFEVRIPPERERYALGRDIAMSFVQYRTATQDGAAEEYGIYARFGALTFEDANMTFEEAGVF